MNDYKPLTNKEFLCFKIGLLLEKSKLLSDEEIKKETVLLLYEVKEKLNMNIEDFGLTQLAITAKAKNLGYDIKF